ncbi:MAG: hypothetical protein AAF467_01020 [Actinomycetota bacterium]
MSVLGDVVDSADLVRAERRAGEAGYAMTAPVMERLGPLGVFRLLGRDRSTGLGEFIRVLEALAHADPSVAWAAANSNGAAMATHAFPDAIAAEMLAESNWFYGVGFPPTGKAERVN